jgi:3-oxoacyl-[acyl-carrier-protein] synthase III
MKQARITKIASYFPDRKLSNADLCKIAPSWSEDKILLKTGIEFRHISAETETAVDLGIGAAKQLFAQDPTVKDAVDYLIFCTQTPDYFLPTSACIIQDALGLKKTIGAIDINQGCSGYVYGLSLAKGLIASGIVSNVLLITADTYTKLINPKDISVRALFGDGATATLVSHDQGDDQALSIGDFIFGTDGAGHQDLIVPAGGFRCPTSPSTSVEAQDNHGNIRSREQLYMDGAKILIFGLSVVPKAIQSLLDKESLEIDDIDHFVFHQASLLMLEKLSKKLKLQPEKMPIALQSTGNTVSSSIPITLQKCRAEGRIKSSEKLLLMGFGVGLSWAACTLQT